MKEQITPQNELLALCSINQIADQYTALDTRKIRHFVNERKFNGLSKSGAVFKVGPRIFLNPHKFDQWLRSHEDGC